MLKLTLDNLIKDLRLRPDAIAFCEETGANLCRSRKQYTLVVPAGENSEVRHWARSRVHSDEDAIERAQKSLNKIIASQPKTREQSDSESLANILRNMEGWSELEEVYPD